MLKQFKVFETQPWTICYEDGRFQDYSQKTQWGYVYVTFNKMTGWWSYNINGHALYSDGDFYENAGEAMTALIDELTERRMYL